VTTAPDVPEPRYVERLWPGVWVWLFGLGGIVSLSVAYGAALGPAPGIAVALLGVVTVAVLVTMSAARIEVGTAGLRAGRALLPWEYVGQVVPLDAERSRVARGPRGDPSAFLLLRPGVGPGSVVVEVTDPEDPHATWLLATRHSRELASAIEQERGRLSA